MEKKIVELRIVSKIIKRIRQNIYKPDTLIPAQLELAGEFHTSPTTISKALNKIHEKGMVELKRGKGTRVIPVNERPEKGIVGIVAQDTAWLSTREAALILQGVNDAFETNSQHARIVFKNELGKILLNKQGLNSKFGGLIFMESMGTEEYIEEVKRLQFPYVVANLEKPMDAVCTYIDHKKTTNTSVLMLAAMGHEKIALLAKDLGQNFYSDAYEGYRSGLKEAGLPFDKKLVIIAEEKENGAYESVNRFLRSNAPPEALVACRDYLAYGACAALQEHGLIIGQDVSVIGFDNLTWPDNDSYLTTFNEPVHELGAKAAEMLIEIMDSGISNFTKQEIEAPLILRRSVGLNLKSSFNSAGDILNFYVGRSI